MALSVFAADFAACSAFFAFDFTFATATVFFFTTFLIFGATRETGLRAAGLVFFTSPFDLPFDALEADLDLIFAFDFTVIRHILFLQNETPSASYLRDSCLNIPGIVHVDLTFKT